MGSKQTRGAVPKEVIRCERGEEDGVGVYIVRYVKRVVTDCQLNNT